ncbi:unnamed protein product [Paramecium sonneborni]|uniref:Uncharacterized protein n=1 Tax=Paramecium sonneborni TaxID=65129 RepID=A0A8S1RLM8_9CILI|nr:unnamed protein product [Paramecium sonneborni]
MLEGKSKIKNNEDLAQNSIYLMVLHTQNQNKLVKGEKVLYIKEKIFKPKKLWLLKNSKESVNINQKQFKQFSESIQVIQLKQLEQKQYNKI